MKCGLHEMHKFELSDELSNLTLNYDQPFMLHSVKHPFIYLKAFS